MRVIEATSAPGAGSGSGDDRYGFDEAAGLAWVIDGATDVGGVRVFAEAESDAAWYASALSRRLTTPPGREPLRNYFDKVLSDVGAEARRAARFDLDAVERYSLPSAAGMWLRRPPDRECAELAWLGDCVAIVRTPYGATRVWGDIDRIDAEAEGVRAWREAGGDAGDRRQALRASRARLNTPGGYWIFSIHSEAAAQISLAEADAPQGSQVLLATDGLYRLVAPYGRLTDAELIDMALEDGLGAVTTLLRAIEHDPANHGALHSAKKSDDASGLLIAFD